MELKPLDLAKVKRGDRVVMRARPDIPVTFKFAGHDACVVLAIEDGYLPERSARDVIIKRSACGLPV